MAHSPLANGTCHSDQQPQHSLTYNAAIPASASMNAEATASVGDAPLSTVFKLKAVYRQVPLNAFVCSVQYLEKRELGGGT